MDKEKIEFPTLGDFAKFSAWMNDQLVIFTTAMQDIRAVDISTPEVKKKLKGALIHLIFFRSGIDVMEKTLRGQVAVNTKHGTSTTTALEKLSSLFESINRCIKSATEIIDLDDDFGDIKTNLAVINIFSVTIPVAYKEIMLMKEISYH